MKFTLSWLKKFLNTEASIEQITEKLTIIGLEVEKVIDKTKEFNNFKVAEIIEALPHPNADKLQICKVNNGSELLQIVCGAQNARAGIKVVLAEVGSLIPNGEFKIKSSEIRGIKSEGMLCSEEELFLGKGGSGIIELPIDAIPGESFLKYYGLDDPVIEVSVTPNRGDCLGVYGIARDLAACCLGTLKVLENNLLATKFTSNLEASIDSTALSPLIVFREFRNIQNHESPIWLKNLLKNIGVNPISAVVDITNYISYSFARPLHAYDKDRLSKKLIVRSANLGEKFIALNDKEYELDTNDIVISDEKQIHALAGIIGGKQSSCGSETTNIILESALFDRIKVSQTGRKLQLHTDARFRFERGVDPEFTVSGLELASQMIVSICGGEASELILCGENKSKHREIEFNFDIIKRRIGIKISQEESLEILENLGFKVLAQENNNAKLAIPSWRSDINISEDVVEEVARIYGYDKLSLTLLPNLCNVKTRLLNQTQARMQNARRVLSTRGLDEAITWSFMSSEKAKFIEPLREELFLANPIANYLNYMRPSIFPNLLDLITKNKARSFTNLGFFEVGPIFKGVTANDEKNVITAIREGNYLDKTIYNLSREVDIYDIKADLEVLLEEFGFKISKFQLSEEKPAYFHPNRAATLKLGNKVIAHFGELHPTLLKEFDLKDRVVGFELFLSELPESKLKLGRKEQYIVSDFQSVQRDFAFLVDKDISVGEMTNFIKNIEKELIKDVHIFDIYIGSNIAANKKSVALNVFMQPSNKTLNDDELQNISDKIINETEKKFNAKIRI